MTLRQLAGLITLAAAATASAQRLAFDAVSIKPSAPGTTGLFHASTPGDLNVEGITVQEFIVRAYQLLPSQIIGLPGWAETEHFDIQAKMMDPANDPAVTRRVSEGKAKSRTSAALMLQPERIQSLLADYFHLTAESTKREMTVYALVVSNPAKIHEVPAGTPYRIQQGVIRGEGVPINVIIAQMAYALDHVLLDKTNLPGYYTVDLNWSSDDGGTSTAPSLRTALQEQLGLKIETQKAPVPVLVVGHVERPSAN